MPSERDYPTWHPDYEPDPEPDPAEPDPAERIDYPRDGPHHVGNRYARGVESYAGLRAGQRPSSVVAQ